MTEQNMNPENPIENEETVTEESSSTGENTSGSNESELSLEEQLTNAIKEKEENYDRWVRSVAELENFRNRAIKERESTRQMALAGLVRNLLPAFDNLQRTIEASGNTSVEDLILGLQMVQKQLADTLGEHAIKRIESVGQPFDPNFHEAVQQLPSDEYDPMVIMQELESGFSLGDMVIRPSKVIVSSGPAKQ